MAYSINLTDAQKTEVTKLIAESASTDDTITTWINEHINTVLETSMRARLHEYIAAIWIDRGEKQETLKSLDPADMETEYAEYFPSE
jgi:macrodomain Ter protein organizer (MatP/YcbG family)